MKHKFISELKVKAEIQEIYFIKYIAQMNAKDGKPYLNVIFSDKTGDLEARSWNNSNEIISLFAKGDFAKVNGRVNSYMGRKQLIISDIQKVDESQYNIDDYQSTSSVPPEEMLNELESLIESLDDYYIKTLLQNIISDSEIQRRLKFWPAGKSIHHAYVSGLLEHILSCANLADFLSPKYKVNKSYVMAGAILHDLCKVYELSDGLNVEYTEEGKLVGHLVKALEIIDRYAYKIPNFPHQMKLHLKHIMLSHHGEYEYGSPKIPQTREAMLVHLIDLMDSKMHSFETVIKNDNTSGHWSGFVKHLDRIIFKNELPTFTSPIKVENTIKEVKKVSKEKEIKNNLGSLLKDFKVTNED